MRPFKGIICDDISEFESYHPSHAVRSLCARSRGFAQAGHALYDPLVLAGAPLRVSDFAQTAAVRDQGMLVWWSIRAGAHVEPHSHANEQIVWMLKGKMEFRLGDEQRVCGPGDVVVIPGRKQKAGAWHG